MKQLIKQALILLVSFVALAACSDGDGPERPDDGRTPRAVLVYMASNNSLSGYDTHDIVEMKEAAKAGHFGKSRLLVYRHPRSGNPALMEVEPSGEVVTLKDYDRATSSVSFERMLEVIADMKRLASADNYGLILWSHGQGWLQNGIEDDLAKPQAGVAPLSFGADGSSKMNITTLAKVLEGQGFDYVYFDCCFMMGVEVVYQLRNATQAVVGSVMELPAAGMPYDQTLRYLMPAKPDLEAAAKTTFEYYDRFTGSDRTCAMSVVKTAGLPDLAEATRTIYQSGTPLTDGFKPQEFMMRNLYVGGQCYIFDFEQYARAKSPDDAAFARWRKAFDGAVTYARSTPKIWDNIAVEHYCGLSSFILKSEESANYNNYKDLDWYRDVARYSVAAEN